MSYTKRFYLLWNGRESRCYLMHAALKLARRMRSRGHAVTVCQQSKEPS